ncbi:MAG TPA: peptidoglycan-binding protein [Beijerinckiaceae bacterium]|nr:peptidoglycan-binding protein [Beijerinckiaceae bacterium]
MSSGDHDGEFYSLARAPQQRQQSRDGARNWQIAIMLMMVGAASACALFLAAPSPSSSRSSEPVRPAGASTRLELRAAVEPFVQRPGSEAPPARKPAAMPAPPTDAVALQRPAPVRSQSAPAPTDDGPALTGAIGEARSPFPRVVPKEALLDVKTVRPATKVQRRLAELGHFSGPATGIWGPISRVALRSFKEANQLPSDDAWDAVTQEALFSANARRAHAFVGRWGPDAQACSRGARKGGFLPTMIESSGARAGDVTCAFKEKRQAGEAWDIVAQCTKARERWNAHIRLAVKNDRLTWTSERGSQTYVRCSDRLQVASE